jgi:hypothetical protein
VRADALLQGNDFSAAEQDFRTAIDAGVNSVEMQVGLSRALSELGRMEEACAAANHACTLGDLKLMITSRLLGSICGLRGQMRRRMSRPNMPKLGRKIIGRISFCCEYY